MKKNKEFIRVMEFDIPSDTKIGEKSQTIIGGINISDFVTDIKVTVLCPDNIDGSNMEIFEKKGREEKDWKKLIKLLKQFKVFNSTLWVDQAEELIMLK